MKTKSPPMNDRIVEVKKKKRINEQIILYSTNWYPVYKSNPRQILFKKLTNLRLLF